MTTFAFTGHRPKDLPLGFDQERFYGILNHVLNSGSRLGNATPQPDAFITGGALGIDTFAAEYALDHGIYLSIITPFTPDVMTKFWRYEDRERLLTHLNMANATRCLGDHYDGSLYQRRNEAMVDAAEAVLAFWTGKRYGGTFNCIAYALRREKPVVNLIDGKVHFVRSIG